MKTAAADMEAVAATMPHEDRLSASLAATSSFGQYGATSGEHVLASQQVSAKHVSLLASSVLPAQHFSPAHIWRCSSSS